MLYRAWRGMIVDCEVGWSGGVGGWGSGDRLLRECLTCIIIYINIDRSIIIRKYLHYLNME